MNLRIIVYDRLYIPIINNSEFYDELKTKLTYKNPDYISLKKLNKYTTNVPQLIKNYIIHNTKRDKYNNYISIPRGAISKLRTIGEYYDIKFSFLDNRLSLMPISGYKNSVELWEEQKYLSDIMIKKENCLIRSPTASGKTEMALKTVEYLLQNAGPVLIIVWETGLLDQWLKRCIERFNISKNEIGIISGNRKKIMPITIGMQQSLKNNINNYKNLFGSIICDEVQRFAAKTFKEVIDKFPARYRFGISADESRKDKKEFLIYDIFGEVAGEIEKIVLLRKEKIIEPTIRIIPTEYNYIRKYGSSDNYMEISWNEFSTEDRVNYFNDLIQHMLFCEERNELIWNFLEPTLKSGKLTLIATTRVEHAKYWDKIVCDAGYTSGLMIGGSNNAKEFAQTVQGMRENKIQVGVGTLQKIGVGLDIKPLERMFIIGPLASNKQKMDQAVGRLRRKAINKIDAVVYYFWDQYIFNSHKTNLKKFYKNTSQIYVDGKFVNLSNHR